MLKQVIIMLSICLVAQILAFLINEVIAASVIALLLVFILLVTKILKLNDIKELGDLLLGNMTILFVPSAVGIIEHLDIIQPIIIPLIFIIVISTVLVFFVVGKSVDLMLKLKGEN